MGFRENAYAKIWSVDNKGTYSKVNLSTSKKVKGVEPAEYETDFSGFVNFVGNAQKKIDSIGLSENDRIRIIACETTTRYEKAKGVKYTNFTIFDWETAGTTSGETPQVETQKKAESKPVETEAEDDDLPF